MELVPEKVPSAHLHLLVVLERFKVRTGLVVGLDVLESSVEYFDSFVSLIGLPEAIRIDIPEKRFLLVVLNCVLEDFLHFIVLLALVEKGAEHGSRYPIFLKCPAQVGLSIIKLLRHVEDVADLTVDL